MKELVIHLRGRWLYSFSLEADQWLGVHKSLEYAMKEAFRDGWFEKLPTGTPIYFCHGKYTRKQECEDWGVEWPWYQVDPSTAITILLP